jgi:hypothetical protein
MGDKSPYLKNNFIDHVLLNDSGIDLKVPAVYVALYNGGTPFGGGSEVSNSGTAYARQQVTFSSSSSGATANINTVTFPTATGAGYTVTHFALFDSVTYGAGNCLYADAISPSQTVSAGNEAKFNIGAITVTEE